MGRQPLSTLPGQMWNAGFPERAFLRSGEGSEALEAAFKTFDHLPDKPYVESELAALVGHLPSKKQAAITRLVAGLRSTPSKASGNSSWTEHVETRRDARRHHVTVIVASRPGH